MSKETVTHACGHTREYQMYGPHRQREARAERMTNEICPDCVRARIRAKAESLCPDMPDLDGSPKQIAWAEDIRARAIPDLIELRQKVEESSKPEFTDALLQIINETIYQQKAKNWIDADKKDHNEYWLRTEYKRRFMGSQKEGQG